MTLSLSSSAFASGQAIPSAHTCKGKGISPPLAWSGAPAGTRSFALIVDDPDAPAGTFVHWVIYNIPASSNGLPESVSATATLPDGTLQGSNSARRTGYHRPLPPIGNASVLLQAVRARCRSRSGLGSQQRGFAEGHGGACSGPGRADGDRHQVGRRSSDCARQSRVVLRKRSLPRFARDDIRWWRWPRSRTLLDPEERRDCGNDIMGLETASQ